MIIYNAGALKFQNIIMKIVKQKLSLPIVNLDDVCASSATAAKKHGELLPASIRCIIAGASNSGKTNVIINLLRNPNALRYENIYVYSKSLNQSKYEFLRQILKPIKGLGYYEFNENDQIIPPAKAKPNSIFIFDDIACDKQAKIQEYFSRGRHDGVDSFYLAQSYARIPKHLIRDNVNMLVLFKLDELNLRHVYDDHVTTDMTFQKFKDVCAPCWSEGRYGFIVIDKDSQLNEGRYRKGFDAYICP